MLSSLISNASSVVDSITLHQNSKLGLTTHIPPSLVHWSDTVYAVGFVQNMMTTGLIIYRIWRQDRKSRDIISRSSSLRLIIVVRIIVESASIYLLNLLILIILYALKSNGQLLALEAVAPVCGEFRHANVFTNYPIFMLYPVSRYCVHADHSSSGFAHINIRRDYPTPRHTYYRHPRHSFIYDRRLHYDSRSVHHCQFPQTCGAHQ